MADQTIIKAASDYFKKMYYTLLVDTSITEKKNLQKISSYILVGCTIDIWNGFLGENYTSFLSSTREKKWLPQKAFPTIVYWQIKTHQKSINEYLLLKTTYFLHMMPPFPHLKAFMTKEPPPSKIVKFTPNSQAAHKFKIWINWDWEKKWEATAKSKKIKLT